MKQEIIFLSGTILDEDVACNLRELCRMCNINAEFVHEMIDEGLITPTGSSPLEWRFGLIEIRRVRTTLRLQRDLRVNMPGCALALDLLEELNELRKLYKLYKH
jgi:chaperone modulatory protein CbpM